MEEIIIHKPVTGSYEAAVDEKVKHMANCTIRTIGTGCSYDNYTLGYIGTYQLNKLVFHVFEYSPF